MQHKPSLWQVLNDQLASIKLTVIILLVIAGSSLIGTLLPQGLAPEQLQAHYGPRFSQLIDFLQLGDLYHAGWFRFLLLLLCLNLVVCTFRRLPKTLKLMRHREQTLDPQKLAKFSNYHRLESKLPWDEFTQRMHLVLAQHFAPLVPVDAKDAYAGLAEKGGWSRLSVYLIHFSVLVVLIGALAGSLLGFKGMMLINERDASNEVSVEGGHQTIKLPFQIRCDAFEVSFYDTGAPKEYRSDLTILDQGKETLKQAIRVNDPLTYKGVTIYQASYGATLSRAEVEFTDRDTGKSQKLVLPFREPVSLPGTPYQVELVEYRENIRDLGPALGLSFGREGQESSGSWILAKVPDFHGNRFQNFRIKVLDMEQIHYTGLQIKDDPGVWVVWIGFSLLLISIGLTFYTSHRKVWVWAAARNPQRVLHIAARSNKNSLAFEREFEQLVKHLKVELQVDKRK
jgi:cytochrome c biogenesis protein